MKKNILFAALLALLVLLCSCSESPDGIREEDLSKYTILYNKRSPDTAVEAVYNIAAALSARCGTELTVIADQSKNPTPETEYEILIGHLDRPETNAFIETLGENEFGYTVAGKKIIIAGQSQNATTHAVELFINEVVQADSAEKKVFLEADARNTKQLEANLSVMSFNLWVIDVAERFYPLVNQILARSPDVFGVQEANDFWMNTLPYSLPDYAWVGEHRDSQPPSERTAIFYRKDKFTLLDSGTYWLSETPEKISAVEDSLYNRIMTYAVLQRNEDGKTFIHINTHLDHLQDRVRKQQVKHLLEIIDTLPDYPIVLTGDFNTSYNTVSFTTTSYNHILSGGFRNAADLALSGDKPTDSSYSGYGEYTGLLPIDFIFINDEHAMKPVLYEVCNEEMVSDHYAVYAELMY